MFRKKDKSVVIEWLVENPPENEDVVARIILQAAAYDLSGLPSVSENLEIQKTPEENWLQKCYREFPPFSIGPFYIYGSHHLGQPEADVPQGQIGLQIDATTAFGSGEHETTKGCLQALLDLKGKGVCPWNILDMGTGSGILALAAWKLWSAPVLAVDNDDEAVRVTERHAAMNGVTLGKGCLLAVCGDGFKTPAVDSHKPYELIIMNILAGPVIEMAPEAVRVLDENGYVILSGMLKEQADLVTSAYEGLGLTLTGRYDLGDWTALALQKRL
ncbi:MAG: 50S ribosomal protein L11 methyltransferase [Alphaproteobacteria bacterium]|nr:50S ribosomal protein L11 methyltransferase [Alphaproteobacteria bacterium]QQS57754.1 MAG: 50S ribosomal protein L11 methyltransferase [Alphaproteobacteria bacterium]